MDKETADLIRSRNLDTVEIKANIPLLDDHVVKRVEIIILKYKSPEMEQDCVSRIIKYTRHPYKLNVFDNRGNGPNTARAWNKLIRESTCDYVLFIDSDAFVQNTVGRIRGIEAPDGVCWLEEMMKAFHLFKDVAIVGPVCGTPATSTMQWMQPADQEPFLIDGHLSGYCFLTHKSIYDKVGYFDEDFCFYGQESDWIERVFESNRNDGTDYKVVIAPRAHVIHGYENEGSVAAKQALGEGELDPTMDASYSYLMWNWKKKQRMAKRGIEYNFKI